MSLGLAKDSMLNLAELAEKKENEEDGEPSFPDFAHDEKEQLMRLSTGEIQSIPSGDDDDPSRLEPISSLEPATTTEDSNLVREPASSVGVAVDHQDEELFHSPTKGPPSGDEASTATDDFHTPDSSFQDDPPDAVKESMASGRSSSSSSPSVETPPNPIPSGGRTSQLEGRPSSTNSPASVPPQAAVASGEYNGFASDYYAHDYGDYHSYDGTPYSLLGGNREKKNMWCCLFPWLNNETQDGHEDGDVDSAAGSGAEALVQVDGRESRTRDDDEASTNSDMFGEKLSDKDRQAVLARLRLAQPDAGSPVSGPLPDGTVEHIVVDPGESERAASKGLLNGITVPKTRKGILKRSSMASKESGMNNMVSSNSNGSTGGDSAPGTKRRSLFSQKYETTPREKKNLNVDFSPMARVLTVKSKNDMSEKEKGAIWWQRADYEEFRKTGRMITKAMLEGGSEIWLATNQSWQTSSKDKSATLQKAVSLAERQKAFLNGDVEAKRDYEDTRDKWWHKFGHSRRGLEHIASIDEGRQRQTNVRRAIKSTLDEQRRQRIFHREDAEKLRMVSVQNTSWARDLALAAGASDADAVSQNFDEESRKSREFYLLKFLRASSAPNAPKTQRANVPAFMKPALSAMNTARSMGTGTGVSPIRLDANTVSQIRFRQANNKKVAPAPTSTKGMMPLSGEIEEPLHSVSGNASMAK